MQSIVEAIPGHDKEIYGVSVDSVIAALILLIFIIIVREIVGLILPTLTKSYQVRPSLNSFLAGCLLNFAIC